MSVPSIVALTSGDPSGIGPEVAAKAWSHLCAEVPLVWIGDPRHLPSGTTFQVIDRPDQALLVAKDALPVLPHPFPTDATPGQPAPENARAVVDVIRRAVDLAMSGDVAAICTAPISKKQLADHAGFAFPGHTEFLADMTGAHRPVMMLASDELKVVPATIHIPLVRVPSALDETLLSETILILAGSLTRYFGLKSPRIAVAGLNPHAGEGGMLGAEEQDMIGPVCDALRRDGLDIVGPLPADTMFHARARESYDAAVAMYHDQALIPIKTLAFDRGVNVTLGLPIIRTSPDHGTAFDIAGRSLADPTSMIEAIRMASRMAVRAKSE